jgi:PAS domain S-box-containing protein
VSIRADRTAGVGDERSAQQGVAPPASHEAEELYRRLVEGAPEAIVVHRDGQILYANPAAIRVVGVANASDLVGHSVLEFVHPQDEAIAAMRARQASRDPGPVESPVHRLLRPDGSSIDVDMVSIPAIYAGAPAAHIVIRDVTDRKRAEAALRETTWTLRALVQASPLAVVSLDPSGAVTMWNPSAERIFGWSESEAIGQPFPAVPAERRDEHRSFLAQTLASETLAAVETQRRTKDGRLIDVSIWAAPLRGADGSVYGVTGFFADISARKRAEAAERELAEASAQLYREAEAAIKARDEFLSVAAHELRTPVTGISAQTQFMTRLWERNDLSDERLARFVDAIGTAAERLTRLTEDLLDVARIRSGRLALRTERFDLGELLRRLVERHQERAEPRHRFVVDLAASGCMVVADPDRLEQVFENLLDNAVKYSPDGGAITVALAGGDPLVVRIADEGIGLLPGTELAIFEPFGRGANAAGRHLPGMGLGLYISRNIVEQHAGAMWAESGGEGRGLVVTVSLPCEASGG